MRDRTTRTGLRLALRALALLGAAAALSGCVVVPTYPAYPYSYPYSYPYYRPYQGHYYYPY